MHDRRQAGTNPRSRYLSGIWQPPISTVSITAIASDRAMATMASLCCIGRIQRPQLAIVIGVVHGFGALHDAGLAHGEPAHLKITNIIERFLMGGKGETVAAPLAG